MLHWVIIFLFFVYGKPQKLSVSDEEYGEKSISVRLDGEEVELSFIDHPSNEMSVGLVCLLHLQMLLNID